MGIQPIRSTQKRALPGTGCGNQFVEMITLGEVFGFLAGFLGVSSHPS